MCKRFGVSGSEFSYAAFSCSRISQEEAGSTLWPRWVILSPGLCPFVIVRVPLSIGFHNIYLCSKSTGAVTSCTRKYLASAGYFRATASYIA
jgi:hypothetical protein